MKKSIIKTIFTMLLLCGVSQAASFNITNVVDVGPIFGGPMSNPAQFSPNGQWIAYFYSNKLFIADSNGVSHTVCDIELVPFSFEWMNNQEIILFHKEWLSSKSDKYRLTKINILDGNKKILEEYVHSIFEKDITKFSRPKKTFEGNVFYIKEENQSKTAIMPAFSNQSKSTSTVEHFLRTGDDALYLVNTDFSDSVKISNKRYEGYMGVMPILLSKDTTHIIYGFRGSIVRLSDDSLVNLNMVIGNIPNDAIGCGFNFYSFNPKYSEIVFRRACDIDESTSMFSFGVFNYTTSRYELLDDSIGYQNCDKPIYAPDGLRIAFIANGELHILQRELQDE